MLHSASIPEGNRIQCLGYGDSKINGKYISGKAQHAEDARAISNPCNVILIGYSAGAESALRYARWRISQGLPVRAIAVLGPTFISFNETQDPRLWPEKTFGETEVDPLVLNIRPEIRGRIKDGRPYYDWSEVMSGLLASNVDILIWGDTASIGVAAGYTKPGGTGDYERLLRHTFRHWGLEEDTTNNSSIAKKEVYDWIYSH